METFVAAIFIIAALAAASAVWRGVREDKRAPNGYHCMTCGVDGDREERSPFGLLAIALWVVSLVAAAVSGWPWLLLGVAGHVLADLSRKSVCASCKGASVIPAHTPAAGAHRAQIEKELGQRR